MSTAMTAEPACGASISSANVRTMLNDGDESGRSLVGLKSLDATSQPERQPSTPTRRMAASWHGGASPASPW
jgi:hypothetical protein